MDRDLTIDVARGIGIMLVYIGHCELNYDSFLFQYIYSFHMPLFFFMSGYLYKEKETYYKQIFSKTISLLIPYVFFSVINYSLLYFFTNYFSFESVIFYKNFISTGWGLNPLWFIPILFLVEVTHCLILSGPKLLKITSITFLVCLAIWKYKTNGWLVYSISEIPWYYSFFLLGFACKNKLPVLSKQRNTIILSLLLLQVAIIYITLIINPNYLQQSNSLKYIILKFVLGIVGTLLVLSIGEKIVLNNKASKTIAWIGKNSLVILCTHLLFYNILQNINYLAFINGSYNHIVVWLLIFISIVSYNKYFNPLIGRLKQKFL